MIYCPRFWEVVYEDQVPVVLLRDCVRTPRDPPPVLESSDGPRSERAGRREHETCLTTTHPCRPQDCPTRTSRSRFVRMTHRRALARLGCPVRACVLASAGDGGWPVLAWRADLRRRRRRGFVPTTPIRLPFVLSGSVLRHASREPLVEGDTWSCRLVAPPPYRRSPGPNSRRTLPARSNALAVAVSAHQPVVRAVVVASSTSTTRVVRSPPAGRSAAVMLSWSGRASGARPTTPARREPYCTTARLDHQLPSSIIVRRRSAPFAACGSR